LWWAAAIGVALILYACNLALGELNQDEGWYLYASRLVAEGRLPYLDFAHTQPPALSFTYALAWPLVERWGVAGGRLFTAVLGLAGALLAALAAARVAPRPRRQVTAFLAFALVVLNAYHSYFTTVVKTYALCGFFIMTGFTLLTVERGRLGRWAAYLAGVALALGAATRLSAGILVPVAATGLWCVRKRRPGDWGRLLAGAGAAGALLVLPFLWLAPENFLFGVLEYHTGRRAGSLLTWLVYRAGFVSRLVQNYFVMAGVAAGVVTAWWLHRRDGRLSSSGEGDWLCRTAWAGILGVTLLHLAAAVPYEDYQVILVPLAAMALAVAVIGVVPAGRSEQWVVVVIFLLSIAAAWSSPVNQSWFVSGRDRVWWRLREKPHLQVLRETAARVRALSGDSDVLLTQDTYLAVEAGLHVPRGLELGPFSYYPELDTPTARRHCVVNRELLESMLRSAAAPVAAFSGYGMTVAAPAITEIPADTQRHLRDVLGEGYAPAGAVRPFGQGETTLDLFVRRP
jgi:hypothetical protein